MTAPARDDKHWTRILYDKFPDLYLPILESRREAGAMEAERIRSLLSGAGVSGGKVLDVACGIGRHSIPLAKLGFEVVGYDLSYLFIAKARSWAKNEKIEERSLRFHEGDLRDIGQTLSAKNEGGFNAILNLFSSLGAYGEEEDLRMVKALHGAAAPGCILIIETLNRDFLLKRFQSFGIHRVSEKLRLLDIARFNVETSTLEDDWRFYTEMPGGDLHLELDVHITGRVYTLQELKKLAVGAGWSYVESHGSLMEPGRVNPESPSVVLVCRKD